VATTPADPPRAAQIAVRKHLERLYGITVNAEQCVIVEIGLRAVVDAGWRIVRTQPTGDDIVQAVTSGGREWVEPAPATVVHVVDEWRGS
jgi:hypothetical protein